jgi:hypothetical protein
MQRLDVSDVVRPIYGLLGVKGLIYSVKNATLESNSFSRIWLACHSQNLKVNCCVHRNLLNHMLSPVSPLHILILCSRSVLILSFHICLSLPFRLLTKILCELTFSPMHVTCFAHLFLLYVITIEIFTPQVIIMWIQM